MSDYPENWEFIAWSVKEKAGWRCEHCLHPHSPETGHTLTVHHLDAKKENCEPKNLAALCQVCHLRFQDIDLLSQGWLFGLPDWLAWRITTNPLILKSNP